MAHSCARKEFCLAQSNVGDSFYGLYQHLDEETHAPGFTYPNIGSQ